MENKLKICKIGIGKANGFIGCGGATYKKVYGLCPMCQYKFYTKDERGKIEFKKKKIKVNLVKEKAFKSDLKEKIKTLSDYAKELQKEVNTIVRLIDKGSVCISSMKQLNEKYDAGHFYSVGSNPSLRFHLDNIHAQSVYANQYLSGDQMNYLNGLSKLYGTHYKDFVIELKLKYKVLKLNKDEYKEKIKIAKEIVLSLKNENVIYESKVRLILRNHFNSLLGIYATA